jgi:hypothetical protein
MIIARTSPVLFASLVAAQSASSALIFSSSSESRAASAEFELVAGKLLIRLSNTSTADVGVPSDVLSGLFFSLSGTPTLTRNSAVLGAGSQVIYDGQPAEGNVGGEWAYQSQSGLLGQFNQGISSSGLGIFGPGNLFPGSNLAGPASPRGLEYGLASAGDNPATGNGGVTGSGGLIRNSVVFTLGNLPTDFTLDDIGPTVRFQYGTSLSEPSLFAEPSAMTPVPEPSTYIAGCLLAIPGLLHLARFVRRSRAGA